MSENVDRNRVFRTTRVRSPLKNDVSWIQKSAQEKDEEASARTEQQAVETRPGLLRLNSYVLSTAKKFESLASPQSPPHQDTHFSPSKRPQAPTEELIQSGEEQPEKSLANATAENKEENADQSNIELNGGTTEVSADLHVNEHISNDEAQPVSSTKEAVAPAEHPGINTTAENKGEYADTADDQSNVEQSEVKVSADAHVESPAAETSAAAGTEECKDTAEILLKPQEEPLSETEPKLEDAGGEPTVQHAEGTCEECQPEQAAEDIVLLKAVVAFVVESSPDESDVINATPEEEAAVQQIVESIPDLVADSVSELPPQPAGEAASDGNQDEGPPEQAVVETIETITEVNVVSMPEAPAVIDAEEEVVAQACLEPVPDLVAESVSKLPLEPAAEAATEVGQDEGPPEQAAEEIVEAVAAVVVEPSPDESDVINAAPEEEAAVQQIVESVPDLVAEPVSELPPQPAAPAEGSHDKDPPEQAVVETVETITEVNVASLPETPAVTEAAGEEVDVQQIVEQIPDLVVVESVSKSPPQPAAEVATEGDHDKGPAEQAVVETLETITEVTVASLPETPAVFEAAGEEVVVQQIVEQVPDLVVVESVSELPPQPAAEAATEGNHDNNTAVQDSVEQVPDLVVESVSELLPQPAVETAAMSAASTEPVIQTRAEEVVECEVQPANNTVVEQSIELPHESAAGRKVELCIEDALEPTTAPEAEAAQEFTYRPIELTEALDVEPPAPEAADEPLKSPEQSHTEEMTPAISDMLQKPVEEPPSRQILYETRESTSVCSICDKIIGNIKISFSEPLVICHPECLKCGVCDKALGDLLTPMFCRNQVIQCDGCSAKLSRPQA